MRTADWADAQADLSLGRAHVLFCWFCAEVALFKLDYCNSGRVSSPVFTGKWLTLFSMYGFFTSGNVSR